MSQFQENKSSYQKIVSHPHFKHFLLYCLSYVCLGQVITCLGPMFPYLAEHEGRLETQYSVLFVARALGFMCGSVLMRFIGHAANLHTLIGGGVGIMAVFSIMFAYVQNLYVKAVFIFIASVGSSFQDVNINLAAIQCYKGQNLGVWLQTIHGAFGIGGLLGPFIVYLFQLNSFTFLGVLSFISLFFYYSLQTPQKMADNKKADEEQKILQLPDKSIYLIAAGFLFAVGQQVSYGGWISSYAVLYKFSTKEHATFYSSLYWISITFFRFVLAFVPYKASYKISGLGLVGIINTFISYFLIFHVHPETGLIVMTIFYGLCNSVLFPLLMTIPQEFGFKLTIKESSIFIIWASLGQGCLAVGVGKLMEWFSYNWLLYSVLVMNVALIIVINLNTTTLMEQKKKDQQAGNLVKLINNYDIGGSGSGNLGTASSSKNIQMNQIRK